jgi:type VI secretion system protein ImpM
MNSGVQVGFFGKLPTLGDFLSRRLDAGFIELWDRWLQQGLTTAREHLGAAWSACYETAAPWRFALEAGACGEQARLGVMLAARDRVGRQFPMTIACDLPPGMLALQLACSAGRWYAALEQLLLQTLEMGLSTEAFDAAVQESAALLSAHLGATEAADLGVCQQFLLQHGAFRLPLSAQGPEAAFAAMSAAQLARSASPLVVLWCQASSADPTLFASRGMPAPALFAELLRWPRQPRAVAAVPAPLRPLTDSAAAIEPPSAAEPPPPGRWQYTALSEPGTGAALAVAAATGGKDDAVTARLTQLSALLRAPPAAEPALIEQLDALLGGSGSAGAPLIDGVMNLAVCLPQQAGHFFAWSGGAAVFRLRGRELTRLTPERPSTTATADNGSLLDLLQPSPLEAPAGAGALQVAHVVGATSDDRYLLCADATYSSLSWGQLVSALEESTPDFAAARLREALAERSDKAAPALVVMIEAADSAPLVRVASTETTHELVVAEGDLASVAGSAPACS